MSREIKFRVWDTKAGWYTKSRMDFLHLPEAKIVPKKQGKNLIFEQFTGLHDKNGKEIYEGDIIKHKYEEQPTIVEYKTELCALFHADRMLTKQDEKICEVIGNIHEHKHLIEEQ